MGEAGKGKLSRREGRWLEERGVGGEERTRGRKEDYKIILECSRVGKQGHGFLERDKGVRCGRG